MGRLFVFPIPAIPNEQQQLCIPRSPSPLLPLLILFRGETTTLEGGFLRQRSAELTCAKQYLLSLAKTSPPSAYETYACFVTATLFVGCWTSPPHASVSQGRICSDKCTCCHTEIEVADQTSHTPTLSQDIDTGPTSPSADPVMPGFR